MSHVWHIFEATLTRDAAQGRFVDELLSMFGSRMQPLMAHLIESGRLTLKDVKEAEDVLGFGTNRRDAEFELFDRMAKSFVSTEPAG